MTTDYVRGQMPYWQLNNLIGEPLSNGKLFSYKQSDKSTIKEIYTDGTGSSVYVLPIIFQQNGSSPPLFFADDDLYFLVIKDENDEIVRTVENYSPLEVTSTVIPSTDTFQKQYLSNFDFSAGIDSKFLSINTGSDYKILIPNIFYNGSGTGKFNLVSSFSSDITIGKILSIINTQVSTGTLSNGTLKSRIYGIKNFSGESFIYKLIAKASSVISGVTISYNIYNNYDTLISTAVISTISITESFSTFQYQVDLPSFTVDDYSSFIEININYSLSGLPTLFLNLNSFQYLNTGNDYPETTTDQVFDAIQSSGGQSEFLVNTKSSNFPSYTPSTHIVGEVVEFFKDLKNPVLQGYLPLNGSTIGRSSSKATYNSDRLVSLYNLYYEDFNLVKSLFSIYYNPFSSFINGQYYTFKFSKSIYTSLSASVFGFLSFTNFEDDYFFYVTIRFFSNGIYSISSVSNTYFIFTLNGTKIGFGFTQSSNQSSLYSLLMSLGCVWAAVGRTSDIFSYAEDFFTMLNNLFCNNDSSITQTFTLFGKNLNKTDAMTSFSNGDMLMLPDAQGKLSICKNGITNQILPNIENYGGFVPYAFDSSSTSNGFGYPMFGTIVSSKYIKI